MKTKRFILSLVVALVLVVTNTYASSFEAFNDSYKISSEEVAVTGAEAIPSWNIVYGESSRPVKVQLNQTRSGDEYIVRCGYFEVKYVNGANGFGVRELRGREQIVPVDLNYKVLNPVQLNTQKIISGTKIANEQVLDMIASFLPDLINEEYKNILN